MQPYTCVSEVYYSHTSDHNGPPGTNGPLLSASRSSSSSTLSDGTYRYETIVGSPSSVPFNGSYTRVPLPTARSATTAVFTEFHFTVVP